MPSTAGRASRSCRKAARRRALDSRKPRPHEPCSTPLMKPRERVGQDSIASAAPAGHSAPMPMPSSARNRNSNAKVGEKPAMKLQIEYHRIEIISGVLRPMRSASQPERDGAHQPQPQRDREHRRHLDQRNVELFRDRHHDQQKDREIERIERPTQPGRDPGHPLILGRLFPPGDFRRGVKRKVDMACSACWLPGCSKRNCWPPGRRHANGKMDLSGEPKKRRQSRAIRPADGSDPALRNGTGISARPRLEPSDELVAYLSPTGASKG